MLRAAARSPPSHGYAHPSRHLAVGRSPSPSSPEQYLRGLPASVLLGRLPVPMLATGLDGIVVYNNAAFATMLGHGADVRLTGYGLPALLDGHAATPPSDCVATLRAANN